MKFLFVKHRQLLLTFLFFTSIASAQKNDNRIFNDSTIKISEIGINTIHSDFGSAIIKDSIYFTTFNDNLFEKSDEKLRRKEYYDLYEAKIDQKGNVVSNRIPVREFITRYNDGPVSWCEKTGELFVTQDYPDQAIKLKPFQKVINRLKIIITKRVNGDWKCVSDYPFNNPEYSIGHPAISESGDTLVFASDIPGGYGETDLYYSVRKNGEWEAPVNFGPKINTAEKEEFPFLTYRQFNDRFLVFSSKGRSGDGGFDLYYTRFPSDFSEIIHFDKPINSPYDDFAMTIPGNAEYGYLTSNRPGTGSDDIYKITFDKSIKPIKKFRQLYVYDRNSLHPISNVRVISCDKQTYTTDVKGLIALLPCKETECEFNASAFGYTDKSKVLLTCKTIDKETTRDTIWMDLITEQKIVLRNIYYDFDKWNILPESAIELDQLVSLMNENPEMKVELGSHTDSRGTVQYNQKLSQLRAQAAVDYIVSKGIDKKRITGKGYGKSQLINNCNENCTPAQHRENRRTEIYIPGFLRGEPVKQKTGDYSDGKPDHTLKYSSFKEHGSLNEKSTYEAIRADNITIWHHLFNDHLMQVTTLKLI